MFIEMHYLWLLLQESVLRSVISVNIENIYWNWFIQHCNATTSELRQHHSNNQNSQEQKTLWRSCKGNLKDTPPLIPVTDVTRTPGSLLSPLFSQHLKKKEEEEKITRSWFYYRQPVKVFPVEMPMIEHC